MDADYLNYFAAYIRNDFRELRQRFLVQESVYCFQYLVGILVKE